MGRILGIDVTPESIRVIEGENKKNHVSILDTFELAPPKLSNGEISNFDEIVESILETIDQKNGKGMAINIIFPSKTLANNLLQIPMSDEKVLKKTMIAEIQQHFGTQEKVITALTHCMDYAVYGDVEIENSRQLSVLMSILRKDIALNCIEMFNEHKFQVKVIDTPVNNLYTLAKTVREKRENIDVVLNVMQHETHMLFCHNNKPIFYRYLRFGIQKFYEDKDMFLEQISRTVDRYVREFKTTVQNVLVVGDVSEWFGIIGSLQESLEVFGKNVVVKEWEMEEEETQEYSSVKLTNKTGGYINSSFATALGLITREVV